MSPTNPVDASDDDSSDYEDMPPLVYVGPFDVFSYNDGMAQYYHDFPYHLQEEGRLLPTRLITQNIPAGIEQHSFLV